MPDGCTVVIGAQQHLEALRERAGSDTEVLAFSDADVLGAIKAITGYRPQSVKLERLFAATVRGAAVINRIKADPTLALIEIQVISLDGEYSRVSPRRAAPQEAAAEDAPVAVAEEPPQLDWHGTRRVPRCRMVPGTEAQVDGGGVMLVDLSSMGAQVVGQAPLKPNQRVRIALADDSGIVRFNAAVVWVSFELPKGVTRYRAGLEFQDANATAVDAFTERHKT